MAHMNPQQPVSRRRSPTSSASTGRTSSWTAKLQQPRAPKRVRLEADFAGIKAGNLLFVGTPPIVDAYIRAIPRGEVRSIERMRREIARRHRCDAMCPVSTAIFLRMVAEAAWEQLEAGSGLQSVAPFWRVVEPGSTTAKKLSVDSRWIELQREAERAGND
jgi:hypothetical protein